MLRPAPFAPISVVVIALVAVAAMISSLACRAADDTAAATPKVAADKALPSPARELPSAPRGDPTRLLSERVQSTPPPSGDPRLPGVASPSGELGRELRAAAGPLAEGRPRPRFVNRLVREQSRHLRLHAFDPINWFPFGAAAFARAQAEQRPLFLSIGYASCHWCRVMHEESFQDVEVAEFMNRHFVAIKVDREERPDVDALYVGLVDAFGGRSGWPLTALLTPSGQVFFGTTYVPPNRDAAGGEGLLALLGEMQHRWAERRENLEAAGRDLSRRLSQAGSLAAAPRAPGPEALARAAASMARVYDQEHAGFGDGPRFHHAGRLLFLLRYHRRTADPAALTMAEATLDALRAGTIRDQLAGGFHRYATAPDFSAPHFEQMLYDQALLARAYLEAWQVTQAPRHAEATRETLDAAISAFGLPDGGFAAALDADRDYYTWTGPELRRAVTRDDAALVAQWFGLGDDPGRRYGLTERNTPAAFAAAHGMPAATFAERLSRARTQLLAARAQRPRPARDDRAITAWNGLMLTSLCLAAGAFDDAPYAARAERLGAYLLEHHRRPDGQAVHSRPGAQAVGSLSDHAFLAQGLLDLFELTGALVWLDAATEIMKVQHERLAAPDAGWWEHPIDRDDLVVRQRPYMEDALPSGNAVAVLNELRVGLLLRDSTARTRAANALRQFARPLAAEGIRMPFMLLALDFAHDVPKEIVIARVPGSDDRALLRAVGAAFVPNRVRVLTEPGSQSARRLALAADKPPHGGRSTAYVCEHGRCELPTAEPEVLRAQLEQRRRDDGQPALVLGR